MAELEAKLIKSIDSFSSVLSSRENFQYVCFCYIPNFEDLVLVLHLLPTVQKVWPRATRKLNHKRWEARLVERKASFIPECQRSGKTVDSLSQRLPSPSEYCQKFYRHARRGRTKIRRSWPGSSWKKRFLPRGWWALGSGVSPIQMPNKNPSQIPGTGQK